MPLNIGMMEQELKWTSAILLFNAHNELRDDAVPCKEWNLEVYFYFEIDLVDGTTQYVQDRMDHEHICLFPFPPNVLFVEDAINSIEDICQVPRPDKDLLHVGPYDLSGDMRVSMGSPDHKEAIAKVEAAAAKYGVKLAGRMLPLSNLPAICSVAATAL